MGKEFAAHIIRDEKNNIIKDPQSIKNHSERTAETAERFALPEFKPLCREIGLLHDIGKYQEGFQQMIYGKTKKKIDHAVCGALAVEDLENVGCEDLLMQYCIAGHHTGIPDGGFYDCSEDAVTLKNRLEKKTQDYSAYKKELCVNSYDPKPFTELFFKDDSKKNDDADGDSRGAGSKDPEFLIRKYAFFTRYCFSCLTDADSLDTESYFYGELRKPKENFLHLDFAECCNKLEKELSSLSGHAKTKLQKTREKLQQQVYQTAEKTNAEIYFMNMPTGSGKTLCSMKTALIRALKTGKKRIIYVIPYNSIIDQTVDTFTGYFGENSVLRHQSTFSAENDKNRSEDDKELIRLLTENWDADIIVTTAVQFFESLYGNKRSKLRKVHNMAESILVFDEVHLMPMDFLQPCLEGIALLTKYFECEALFLTATMPNFKTLFKKYTHVNLKMCDLIKDTSCFKEFKKCSYRFWETASQEELLCEASKHPSSLIIVNSKKTAKNIFEKCQGRAFHLSTYMTALDRTKTICQIHEALSSLEQEYPGLEGVPEEKRVIVVSTSLIEAGVDFDFYTVYRELTGLYSILQSGGRCNREGKRKNAETVVFAFSGETAAKELKVQQNITRQICKEFSDISSPECVQEYYSRLIESLPNRDRAEKHTLRALDIWDIAFASYAKEFQMIKDDAVSVVIPEDEESEKMVLELKKKGKANERSLQKYCASVSVQDKKILEDIQTGEIEAIKQYGAGIWVLENMDLYDKRTGILIDPKMCEATDFFI